MLMMISPAKKLEMQASAPLAGYTQAQFLDRSQELIDTLRGKAAAELQALMKISPALGELNARRFRDWQRPFTLSNAKQAMYAFRGDVYASLDADSLNEDQVAYAQDHLRILSGLYGLLRPLDLMQAYRLEMGTKLANPRGRDLYAFWGDAISLALRAELESHAEPILVNLASGEYAQAVDAGKVGGRCINIHFKEQTPRGLRVIGIHAKRARGLMCRYAITRQTKAANELQGFVEAGYSFQPGLSSDSDWVFAR